MKYTIIDCEQRSETWYAARCGRLTGSVAGDMLAKIKSGEAAGRRNLRVQLVVERLTGSPQEDSFVSKEMIRGREKEPLAVGVYEAETGSIVQRCGFVSADDLPVGCSLDGYIDDFVGIVEMKCPNSATHLEYMRGGTVPSEYMAQVRHNVWVTGAKWADFVSFDDRFPEDLQLFRVRIAREDLELPAYEDEVMRFLAEVNVELNEVKTIQLARAA
jgi:predicted phage-related endonuclease